MRWRARLRIPDLDFVKINGHLSVKATSGRRKGGIDTLDFYIRKRQTSPSYIGPVGNFGPGTIRSPSLESVEETSQRGLVAISRDRLSAKAEQGLSKYHRKWR